MELSDLLQWLGSARKTGECVVRRDATTRHVYLRDGRIVGASSNEPHLLLGQFLVAHGRIDENVLLQCMRLQEAAGRSLGTLLVEAGHLTQIELEQAVRAKTQETVYGLFDWGEARFRFEQGRRPPRDTVRLDLPVESVTLEGVRRLDEMNRIRKQLPSRQVVLHRTNRAPDPPTVASYLGRNLYDSLDGKRTLAEIVLACRVSEYDACSFLVRLLERGIIRVGEIAGIERGEPLAPASVEHLWELVAAGEYDDALEYIERHALRRNADRSLEMLIAKAESGFLAEAYRTRIPPDSVPTRVPPPDAPSEPLGSEELFLLDIIDDAWDVRALTWIAPLRKVDVVRGLIRLRRAGQIELRVPPGVGATEEAKSSVASVETPAGLVPRYGAQRPSNATRSATWSGEVLRRSARSAASRAISKLPARSRPSARRA